MYVITSWEDVGRAWWWGFLDRITQPNERQKRGMREKLQGIKWSQCVSRLKTDSDRNSMYPPKHLFYIN